jgi:GxxExxY protein
MLKYLNIRRRKVAKIKNEKLRRYDGEKIGRFRLDLVIDGKVIVELKAVERLSKVFREQLISQLKASPYEVGLLVNFGMPKLEYIKIARSKNPSV